MNPQRQPGKQPTWPAVAASVIAVFGVLLAGCSKSDDKPASQVVAKVNKQEITIHQVNFLLEQQRGLRPDQADAARKQALERLIDQELAIQKLGEIKLDRDPRVMQQLEAARREVLSRAYYERVGEGASKPSDAQVFKYFNDNPALFAERRVYRLQEWLIEATPAQLDAVREKAQSGKALNELTDYLRANSFKFDFNQAVRPAEQLPLDSLASFAKMKDGETLVINKPNGLLVIAVVNSRLEPVELARAKPAIEQFLLNEQKRRIIADDIKALRAASTIRYVGSFANQAETAASQPSPVGAVQGAASGNSESPK
ncbi:EpsD family peptidyl-prolyl cis-trans isomerase [Piscinibacter gummiphilus]|uniref:EpsD family peptidyl-prolyl cis-trans isomerase n=1 Tax=Piscinibacter gummiphilus TaxID=946333 RepID=A0ABZ0CWD3_9BURK|nr:EpsD family peptidyl-prolyl cis-trans isomerase [Piscinibacter gummiphilus]WOB07305.1 EpsD family peptidyl-prolyl cis-trans isomerase [Piscinibacter gummiphilus]